MFEFISFYWPDLIMLFGIGLLAFVAWKRPTRKAIALMVIGEQCFTYLLFWYIDHPIELRLCYGFMYTCIYFAISNFRYVDKSIAYISKVYLFIGIYHILMAVEPWLIKLFGDDSNIIPYLNYAHWGFNIVANILIISLVVFGGRFGNRRKHSLHDFSHCCFGFAAGLDHKSINERK